MFTRWRVVVAMVCCLLGLAAQVRNVLAAGDSGQTVLVIGDSISAEYGLERGTGWVSLVADKLKDTKSGYRVQNASISGDTTSGGVSRLPDALVRYSPDIVVIELGSNDALRGLSLEMTQRNLSAMIEAAQQAGARVLLLGMQIPPNYGRQYTEQFKQLFTTLARQYHISVVPFFLEGMATDVRLFQADGLHPNKEAQPILAQNAWAKLEPMLKQ